MAAQCTFPFKKVMKIYNGLVFAVLEKWVYTLHEEKPYELKKLEAPREAEMQEEKERQSLIENLKDAGCNEACVNRFLALERDGKTEEIFALLAQQRDRLLEKVHREEKRIYCLDYLVYRLHSQQDR